LERTGADGDHGRIEERRHVVYHKVDWLFSDRRYADEARFPNLAMIGMVETCVERNGVLARERRCYLSSAPLDAKTSLRPAAPIGGSRTGCIGFLMSSSMTISPDCAASTARKTRRSSNTWP
jgi:hypothetical protein